jgi:aminoglycoside phosphotransferase (APT) family kinase protein
VYVVEEALTGELYADRLARYAAMRIAEIDSDVHSIVTYLAQLHEPVPNASPSAYRRMLRQTLYASSVRIMDAGDSYWSDRRPLQRSIEEAIARWRVRLVDAHHRVRRTHNDFHPWNIFLSGTDVRCIGARPPGYGDPAMDLASLMLNYVWFSYLLFDAFEEPFLCAFKNTWRTYVELTGDSECASVFAPFLARGLLILLNPQWYPNVRASTSRKLETLLCAVLLDEVDVLNFPEALSI